MIILTTRTLFGRGADLSNRSRRRKKRSEAYGVSPILFHKLLESGSIYPSSIVGCKSGFSSMHAGGAETDSNRRR